MSAMLTNIGTVFTEVIAWVGEFVTALTSETGGLNGLWPIFAISIGIALVGVCVRIVRSITFGA